MERQTRSRQFRWMVAVLLPELILVSTALCTPASDSSALQIGVLVCLSGDCAEAGTESLRGAMLAVEEINASSGVNGRSIELKVEDSREMSPANAVTAFLRLRAQGISLIIGPTWTPAGLALAPLIAKDPSLLVTSPSLGVRDFNQTAPNIFNTWPHDERVSRKLAREALRRNLVRAAIVSSMQPWEKTQGDIIAEEFSAGGGIISAKVEPLPTADAMRDAMTRVAASKPEVIFFSSMSSHAAAAALALRRLGYKGPLFCVQLDRITISAGAGAFEEALTARFAPASSDFVQRYRAKYNSMPGISADTAYDAVYLYAHAIEASHSMEAQTLARTLLNVRDFPGASGVINFDEFGGVVREPTLAEVRDGEVAQSPEHSY